MHSRPFALHVSCSGPLPCHTFPSNNTLLYCCKKKKKNAFYYLPTEYCLAAQSVSGSQCI